MNGVALRLAPKLSIVVDGGGRFHLGSLTADLRVSAFEHEDGVRWLLSLGGTARSAKPVALLESNEIVPIVLEILGDLAALGPATRARAVQSRYFPTRLCLVTLIAGSGPGPSRRPR